MIGRKLLPHGMVNWIDPEQAVWFITVCCRTRGGDQLISQEVSSALRESVAYRHEKGLWYAHIFLFMPDHCHALISLPADGNVMEITRVWKHWTAFKLQIDWQRDFFDHRVRNAESFAEKYAYILDNPLRAGLVDSSEQWPHVWLPPEFASVI